MDISFQVASSHFKLSISRTDNHSLQRHHLTVFFMEPPTPRGPPPLYLQLTKALLTPNHLHFKAQPISLSHCSHRISLFKISNFLHCPPIQGLNFSNPILPQLSPNTQIKWDSWLLTTPSPSRFCSTHLECCSPCLATYPNSTHPPRPRQASDRQIDWSWR